MRLYPECDFKGTELCLSAEGYFNAAALEKKGLLSGKMRSLRVAPGYYARLDFTGDRSDGWDAVYRGEESCLYSGEDPGGFAFKNVATEKRSVCRPRPRAFMALHGANRLATPEFDAEWSWVREHLDGIWENGAGMTGDESAAIFHKVKTRTVITEQDGAKDQPWNALRLYSGMQSKYPDIVLDREAMAIYKHPASDWAADDVALARKEYVENLAQPEWLRYRHVYGGFQPQQFILAQDNPKEPTVDQLPGKQVLVDMQGAFAECGGDTCRAHLKRALLNLIGQLHATGRPFIWFNGPPTPPAQGELLDEVTARKWIQGLKREYFMLEAEGALWPNDVVMLINYSGALPSTPETDAAHPDGAMTASGVLYWLMHQ